MVAVRVGGVGGEEEEERARILEKERSILGFKSFVEG